MHIFATKDKAGQALRIIAFVTLVLLGIAGNYFAYPIFLNIDFLFGSIFALLALQFLGLRQGVLAAVIISSYTYLLWKHPYAIIIMSVEVAVVGWLMTRKKLGLVIADTIYWLIMGIPLVFLLYYMVMGVSINTASITMTKQAMNGIANALVARIIYFNIAPRFQTELRSFRENIYNIMAFFVLLPALTLLAMSSKSEFTKIDTAIRSELKQSQIVLKNRIGVWASSRKNLILLLADKATSLSPQQMQPYLEMAKKSDQNFLRIGLLDKDATITAYYPATDDLGHKSIGKNFRDRPFIPELTRTLKPMLSEVVMGRIGAPGPMITMLAPVVIHGEYAGYITGILSFDRIQQALDDNFGSSSALYTLLDKNGRIITTNRPDMKIMEPFRRTRGTFIHLDADISQWVPETTVNTSVSMRWKDSFYVTESKFGEFAEWTLILEQPIAPYQQALYEEFARKLGLLLLIFIACLGMAEWLGRKLTHPIGALSQLTEDLSQKLAAEDEPLLWPDSKDLEVNHLIINFKSMADALRKQFEAIKNMNASLEETVATRTAELTASESRFRRIADEAPLPMMVLANDGEILQINRVWSEITGYTLSDTSSFALWSEMAHGPDAARVRKEVERLLLLTGKTDVGEFEIRCKDGHKVLWHFFVSPLGNLPDGRIAIIGMAVDVTLQRQYESAIRRLSANHISVREEEGKRIAREIHDELGQRLTLLKMDAWRLEKIAVSAIQKSTLLEHIRTSIDECVRIVRDTSYSLRPATIDMGIGLAVKELLAKFRDSNPAEYILTNELGDNFRLDDDVTTAVYRILQEALTNTVRHSQANRVEIRITRHAHALHFEVADNGVGIDPESIDSVKTFGLMSMRERAGMIGAAFSIASVIGEGTTVRIILPLTSTATENVIND